MKMPQGFEDILEFMDFAKIHGRIYNTKSKYETNVSAACIFLKMCYLTTACVEGMAHSLTRLA
jgi:hypothetical protein